MLLAMAGSFRFLRVQAPFWKINADPYRHRRLIGFRRIAPILANSGLFFWLNIYLTAISHLSCQVVLFTLKQ